MYVKEENENLYQTMNYNIYYIIIIKTLNKKFSFISDTNNSFKQNNTRIQFRSKSE